MARLSFTDTIEKEMRKLFSIPDEKETRLWNKYMSNMFEPLNKPDSTVQDAGLYQGQVRKSSRAFSPQLCNKLLIFFGIIHSSIHPTMRLTDQPF